MNANRVEDRIGGTKTLPVVGRTTNENKVLSEKSLKNRFFKIKNKNLKNVYLVLRDYTFRYQGPLTVYFCQYNYPYLRKN